MVAGVVLGLGFGDEDGIIWGPRGVLERNENLDYCEWVH